jgi:hypothetical protein
MFNGMTSAETLGWFSNILLIGVPAIGVLTWWAAFHLPFAVESERTPLGQETLGEPGHFREPADPAYVDELIRARGVARVLHRPDPVTLPARVPVSPYRLTLAEVVAGVAPRSPYVAGHADRVGRHRYPAELAAA